MPEWPEKEEEPGRGVAAARDGGRRENRGHEREALDARLCRRPRAFGCGSKAECPENLASPCDEMLLNPKASRGGSGHLHHLSALVCVPMRRTDTSSLGLPRRWCRCPRNLCCVCRRRKYARIVCRSVFAAGPG